MLSKYDVGVLEIGMRVFVDGNSGVVVGVHEPRWISHETRSQMHELQGADILLDGKARPEYIHCDRIDLDFNIKAEIQ